MLLVFGILAVLGTALGLLYSGLAATSSKMTVTGQAQLWVDTFNASDATLITAANTAGTDHNVYITGRTAVVPNVAGNYRYAGQDAPFAHYRPTTATWLFSETSGRMALAYTSPAAGATCVQVDVAGTRTENTPARSDGAPTASWSEHAGTRPGPNGTCVP